MATPTETVTKSDEIIESRQLWEPTQPLDPDFPVAGWITNVHEGERMLRTGLLLDRGPKLDQENFYECVGLQANNRGGFPKLQLRPGQKGKTFFLNANEIRCSPGRYTFWPHVFSRSIPSATDPASGLQATKCSLVIKEITDGNGKGKSVKQATAIKYTIELVEEDLTTRVLSEHEESIIDFLTKWKLPTLDWIAWDHCYEKALKELADSGESIQGVRHTLRAGQLLENGGEVSPSAHIAMMSLAQFPSLRQLLLAAKLIATTSEYFDVRRLQAITTELNPESGAPTLSSVVELEKKLVGQCSPEYKKLSNVVKAKSHVTETELATIVDTLYFRTVTPKKRASAEAAPPAAEQGPYRIPKDGQEKKKQKKPAGARMEAPPPPDSDEEDLHERGRSREHGGNQRSHSSSSDSRMPSLVTETSSSESDSESEKGKKPSRDRDRKHAPRNKSESDSDSADEETLEEKIKELREAAAKQRSEAKAKDLNRTVADMEGGAICMFLPKDGSIKNAVEVAKKIFNHPTLAAHSNIPPTTGSESAFALTLRFDYAINIIASNKSCQKVIEEGAPPEDEIGLERLIEKMAAAFWTSGFCRPVANNVNRLLKHDQPADSSAASTHPVGSKANPIEASSPAGMEKVAKGLPEEQQNAAVRGACAKRLNTAKDVIASSLFKELGWTKDDDVIEWPGEALKGGKVQHENELRRVCFSSAKVHAPGTRDPLTQYLPASAQAMHAGLLKTLVAELRSCAIWDVMSDKSMDFKTAKAKAEKCMRGEINPKEWADVAAKCLGSSAPANGTIEHMQNGWYLMQTAMSCHFNFLGLPTKGLDEINRRLTVAFHGQRLSVDKMTKWLSRLMQSYQDECHEFRQGSVDSPPEIFDMLQLSSPIERKFQLDITHAALKAAMDETGSTSRASKGADKQAKALANNRDLRGRSRSPKRDKDKNQKQSLWVSRPNMNNDEKRKVEGWLRRDAPKICRAFVMSKCTRGKGCKHSHKKNDLPHDLQREITKRFGGHFEWKANE